VRRDSNGRLLRPGGALLGGTGLSGTGEAKGSVALVVPEFSTTILAVMDQRMGRNGALPRVVVIEDPGERGAEAVFELSPELFVKLLPAASASLRAGIAVTVRNATEGRTMPAHSFLAKAKRYTATAETTIAIASHAAAAIDTTAVALPLRALADMPVAKPSVDIVGRITHVTGHHDKMLQVTVSPSVRCITRTRDRACARLQVQDHTGEHEVLLQMWTDMFTAARALTHRTSPQFIARFPFRSAI
jgi:hypothetical protein